MKLEILYEDQDIIVCVKPAGIASQNERGFGEDMVSILMKHEKEQKQENIYIGVVHRLDKMVGGVMVYAKNKRAAADLSAQVAKHQVTKKYYAVICGRMDKKEGTFVDYLVRDGKTNTSKVVSSQEKNAKRAELHYRVKQEIVQPFEKGNTDGTEGKIFGTKGNSDGIEKIYSLVEVELMTGRHHQIRVQFASRNFGLYGDCKYHSDAGISWYGKAPALYSYCLGFTHPVTKKKLWFEKMPEAEIFHLFGKTL